jgi:hypothetical protein
MNIYNQDGLTTIHNHDFMEEQDFLNSYDRGVKASGKDYQWHWRVHIGIWAAKSVMNRPGDFVECGVNSGFMSSSIMHALKWDSLGKTFFLLDSFNGINEGQASKEEIDDGILEKNGKLISDGFYVTNSKEVRNNFSEWKNIKIIEGFIPETLTEINSSQICFLHIDLNCAAPEIAAIDYLWEKLVTGAIVLLDDYAYSGYEHQKRAMDRFSESKGIAIASLPTGQGLIFKNH